MRPSSLQLKKYFFTKILLEAKNLLSIDKNTLERGLTVNTEVEVLENRDDKRTFKVILRVNLPDAEKVTYTGAFEIIGLFQVGEEVALQDVFNLAQTNGPTLLFGAVREMILNLTARGPWPKRTLPTVTFAVDTAPPTDTSPPKLKKPKVKPKSAKQKQEKAAESGNR